MQVLKNNFSSHSKLFRHLIKVLVHAVQKIRKA
jgi:hypothetical protein